MLLEMQKWLSKIEADSLLEAIEEILTIHKLNVPGVLRKNIKYYKSNREHVFDGKGFREEYQENRRFYFGQKRVNSKD